MNGAKIRVFFGWLFAPKGSQDYLWQMPTMSIMTNDEAIDWIGEDFDRTYFDPAEANAILATLPDP